MQNEVVKAGGPVSFWPQSAAEFGFCSKTGKLGIFKVRGNASMTRA